MKGTQLDEMHRVYKENNYPTKEKKQKLSEKLNLEYKKIDKWFSNKRASDRLNKCKKEL